MKITLTEEQIRALKMADSGQIILSKRRRERDRSPEKVPTLGTLAVLRRFRLVQWHSDEEGLTWRAKVVSTPLGQTVLDLLATR
jgi:hypothetical protein